MAALRRVLRLGIKPENCPRSFRALTAYSTSSSSSSSSAPICRFDDRQFSPLEKSNGTRACLVDTLALVRSLEAQGVPSKQAEAITSAIIEVLNDSLENVAHSFVSKVEMQKERHLSMLQLETEKLRGDIDKRRSELKYEIDKVTAGQRLDLNLERGRIRDELANQNAEITNLTNKLDREIHALRAQLEAARFDVIKDRIRTLVSRVNDAIVLFIPKLFTICRNCGGRGHMAYECPSGRFMDRLPRRD